MERNKISIAKKTLKLLEKKSWKEINLSDIIDNRKSYSIKDKDELLININRYFDFSLNKNLLKIEKSSKKDMLFEVFMARLDILNKYRFSIKRLMKFILSHPHQSIKLFPSFIESIILMATISNISVNGIKGVARIKALFILYLLILYTWSKDETESLEKTMTTLDQYLNYIDKFINLI